MFNFSLQVFPETGLCRAVGFFNHIVYHENYASKSKCFKVPFNDEDGNPMYAHSIDLCVDDEQIRHDEELRIAESLRCSISRTKKRIKSIALSGQFNWFCTYTFSPDIVDRYDYYSVSKLFGKYLAFLRRKFPNLQYLVVPEKHKDGAFHFHGLFSNLDTQFAGYFVKSGETYHDVLYKYGFTQCSKVRDPIRVANYISKYITKELVISSKHNRRYWYSYSTITVPVPDNFFVHPEDLNSIFSTIEHTCGGVIYETDKLPFKTKIAQFSLSMYDLFIEYIHHYECIHDCKSSSG